MTLLLAALLTFQPSPTPTSGEIAAAVAALATAPAVRVGNPIQLEPTLPPPPTTSAWTVWDRLAECESGGDWSINTGNGYYGGLQFSLTSWRAVGGSGYPHQNTRAEQILRAEKLLDLQGWNAWPACSRKLGLR